jgi:hypothetical protein
MVQSLGGETVVLPHPVGRVLRVREHAAALAEHLGVEPDQRVPESDISFVVPEVAVNRAAQLVRRAVLMDQPGDLVRVAHEVRRELRRDHQIDRPSVALAEIEQPPRGGVGKDLALRIPLERHADELRLVAAHGQLARELPHVNLGAAMYERHLGLTDDHGSDWHQLPDYPASKRRRGKIVRCERTQ